MRPTPRGYLPTLDGWRAIAILMVMVAHASNPILAPGAAGENAFWYAVTRYGAKGVDVFFGISGFLICSRLLEEHEAHGTISLKGFYIRRALRILPPYAVYLLVLVLLAALGAVTLTRTELLMSIFFSRNLFHTISDAATWFTGHLWSLAVEEHFYLLWPGLLVFWTPSRARRNVVVFALAIAVWRVVEYRLRLLEQVLPGVSFFERTDIRLDALLWGCWFALILREPAWRERCTRLLSAWRWWLLMAALVAVMVLPIPLAMMWQAMFIAAAIAGTTLNPASAVGRLLEAAPLRWIGRISYSLYLWQNLFLIPLGAAWHLGVLQTLPLNLAAAFAAAALSYYVVERPMIKLGHRLAPPTTAGRA